VHLEGTIRRETAVALSAQNGLPEPPPYKYSDLAGFLAVYGQVSRCMVTSQDFERVIFEHGEVMPEIRNWKWTLAEPDKTTEEPVK